MEQEQEQVQEKGRMSEAGFQQFLEGLSAGYREKELSLALGIGRSIMSWCIRYLNRNGPKKAHQLLVMGKYPGSYTDEELERIAVNYFYYGISTEELEVAFGTSRHLIARRVRKMKQQNFQWEEIIPLEVPAFTIRYLNLIRARIPFAVVSLIEAGLLAVEPQGTLSREEQKSILAALYYKHLSEQELEQLNNLALNGQGQQLLYRLQQIARHDYDEDRFWQQKLTAAASGINGAPGAHGVPGIQGDSAGSRLKAAPETVQSRSSSTHRYGRASAPVAFPSSSRHKDERSMPLDRDESTPPGRQEQAVTAVFAADKLKQRRNRRQAMPEWADEVAPGEEDEEQLRQDRVEALTRLLSTPAPKIPASSYKPGTRGPLPDIDPDSDGFDDYPVHLQCKILERQMWEKKIRERAITLLGNYSTKDLITLSTNRIRYRLLQNLQSEFVDLSSAFIQKVIGLTTLMKNYYEQNPYYDRHEQIADYVRKCFEEHGCQYGKRRLCQALRDEYDIYISVPTTKKIMDKLKLKVVRRKRNNAAE